MKTLVIGSVTSQPLLASLMHTRGATSRVDSIIGADAVIAFPGASKWVLALAKERNLRVTRVGC